MKSLIECWKTVGVKTVATLSAVALVVGIAPVSASAAVIKYDLPKKATPLTHTATDAEGNEYDYRHLTTAATMYAEFNVEMLGIDDLESNPKTVVSTWDAAQSQSKAGILASNANIQPDEFLANYYYNIYVAENPSLGFIPTPDSQAIYQTRNDTTDITADHDNLPYSVYYGADILFATNEATMGEYINTKNAGKQPTDPDYYDPIYCAAGTGTTSKMVDGEFRLANAADQIILRNENEKGQFPVQSRYVDGATTYEIADDFAKVAYGSQYAVLKAIADGKTTKKTVAVVADYDSTSQTYKLMNLDVNRAEIRGTGYAGHIAAGIENTVNDLCDTLGATDDGTEKYVSDVTAAQLAKADYVLLSDYFSDLQYSNSQQLGKDEAVTLLKQAMGADADGRILANYPGLVFNFLYASSAESIFNYAIAQSFVYSDVLNYTDMMAYWYNKINHVSTGNLQDMIDTLCANVSLPKGMTSIGTTSEAGINGIDETLEAGMAYYKANADAVEQVSPALAMPDSTTFGVGRTQILPQTYTGKAIEPAVNVYTITGDKVDADNYSVAFANNTNEGRASVTVTGKAGTAYEGQEFTTYFMIVEAAPEDITSATVTLSEDSFTYTGNACEPTATVTYNGTALTKDADYTVAYANNVNAGTATVTIEGKDGYAGTIKKEFEIAKASYDMSSVALAPVKATYNGSARSVKATNVPEGVSVAYTIAKGKAAAKAGNSATAAGTYTVTAAFSVDSNHEAPASMTASLVINKAASPMTAKAKKASFKKKAKKQTTSITVKKAQGKVTYKVTKGKAKSISVSKKGKVTIKKNAKKGTYKITVSDAGNGNYKAGKKVVTIKVK